MEEVSTALTSLINNLEPAFQKLSEVFCISVDTIRQNGMEYIMMYGKFCWVQDISIMMPIVAIIYIIASVFIGMNRYSEWRLNTCYRDDKEQNEIHNKKIAKKIVLFIIGGFVLIESFLFIAISTAYFACPEVYSIKMFMSLF